MASATGRPTTETLFARANAYKIASLSALKDLPKPRNMLLDMTNVLHSHSINGNDMTLDDLERLAFRPNLLGTKIPSIRQNNKYLLKRAGELTTIKGESDRTLDELERLAVHPSLLTGP